MESTTPSTRPNITVTPLPRSKGNGQGAPSVTPPGAWQEQSPAFGDLVDAVNPLQHIPVVSTLYKSATGDGIGVIPRLIGGALFGGVIGVALAAVNAIVEQVSGKDVGETVLAGLSGDETSQPGAAKEMFAGHTKGNSRNEYLTLAYHQTREAGVNVVV